MRVDPTTLTRHCYRKKEITTEPEMKGDNSGVRTGDPSPIVSGQTKHKCVHRLAEDGYLRQRDKCFQVGTGRGHTKGGRKVVHTADTEGEETQGVMN